MLVAIQPAALPCTLDELRKVEQYVSKDCLVKLGIPEATASVDNVALHLSDTSIAHFACHGRQNRTNPLDSALILDDGPLPVSRIMKTSMPNASLVSLCACETAMGDDSVPDEAMHLAATMLFAGFRGAVATMW
jgi:CHAT domain-containing protein